MTTPFMLPTHTSSSSGLKVKQDMENLEKQQSLALRIVSTGSPKQPAGRASTGG
eukprot:CAMPEP_0177677706 /NCGR_PEP_ID=MMETSP0447-20121125/28569_1 /TAXON_ID=0 /ORGANISM="Stygamoeba regulata, Strain BSH-02190019" /LENGTH=53 /DNA_ID=CAMNT_0019186561 /DNA_START=72 /DNA_END=230 /DNA_ORIENTATION=+